MIRTAPQLSLLAPGGKIAGLLARDGRRAGSRIWTSMRLFGRRAFPLMASIHCILSSGAAYAMIFRCRSDSLRAAYNLIISHSAPSLDERPKAAFKNTCSKTIR